MAYGISLARFRRAFRDGPDSAAQSRGPAAALVLRLECTTVMQAALGPVLMRRVLDAVAARLVAELRFSGQRTAAEAELAGTVPVRGAGDLPGLLARLSQICRRPVDLGEIVVSPVINAAVVSDDRGHADADTLYRLGCDALRACSPFAQAGQIRFVEYQDGQPAGDTGEPGFDPDSIRVDFQPQLCCDTGRVVAMRAVARLDPGGSGAVDLDDILARLSDDARQASLAVLLRQALAGQRAWDNLGHVVPFVSIALADRDLADPLTVDAILWELDRQDVPARRLEIEVCEPLGRHGGRVPVTAALQRLAAAGCRIAVGEFGTGSTALDDLRHFGVGRVRVGGAFTGGCDHRAEQQRMILAIIALAEHLGVQTLADGVLAVEERAFLAQIGFNAVQGRAVVPPIEAWAVPGFLAGHEQTIAVPDLTRRRA